MRIFIEQVTKFPMILHTSYYTSHPTTSHLVPATGCLPPAACFLLTTAQHLRPTCLRASRHDPRNISKSNASPSSHLFLFCLFLCSPNPSHFVDVSTSTIDILSTKGMPGESIASLRSTPWTCATMTGDERSGWKVAKQDAGKMSFQLARKPLL